MKDFMRPVFLALLTHNIRNTSTQKQWKRV